jgi:hypothetical protein
MKQNHSFSGSNNYFCTMQETLKKEVKAWPVLFNCLAVLTLLILLAERLWLVNLFPLHIDEVYTFVAFTYNGLVYSICHYPAPNNHVLLSFITAGFYHLLDQAFWSLRLPALLISLLVTVYAFLTVRRLTSFWVAFLGVGLFSFSHLSLLYSFSARGYFLLTGFVLLAAFSMLDFIRMGNRKFLVLVVLATAFGFFTVPVFLYPCVSVFLFGVITLWMQDRKKQLVELLLGVALAGLLTLLLYTPIFLTSGIKAVTGNEYVVAADLTAFQRVFFSWLADLANTLVGREPNGWWLTFAVLLGLLFNFLNGIKKCRKSAFAEPWFRLEFFLLCLLLTPLVCIAFQRVLPPARVFLYLGVFQFVAFAWLLERLFRFLNAGRVFPGIAMVLLLAFGLHQARVLKGQAAIIHRFSSYTGFVKLMEKEQPRLIYVGDVYYVLTTQYAFLSKKLPSLQIDSQAYNPEIPYEYVLFQLGKPLPETLDRNLYHEVYRDVSVVAFKRL